MCILVTSYFIDVKKPYGLKKPVNQYVFGLPIFNQSFNCLFLSINDANQPPKNGNYHEISAPDGSYNQAFGTLASNIELIASKISGVIIIEPSMASTVSANVFLTLAITFYILYNSWYKKIFNGTLKPLSFNYLGPANFLTYSLNSVSI